ncbi:Alpha/Beta hydrolase protein [Lyophyllum atratum]|nr:Alpha/Beta hydrolase protein [Lyophyllum atratum]
MNSVYFPAHVVLVLRRIVNVISTLSISNQYLLLKQAKLDDERPRNPGVPFDDLAGHGWPRRTSRSTWDWHRLVRSDATAPTLHDSGSRPWQGRRWSWPALLSTFTEQDSPMHAEDPPPPPKPQKSRRSDTPTNLPPPEPPQAPAPLDTIHQLIQNPALRDPLRTPRYPIVLCHGLYGFDSRGPLKFPSMRMHYWSNVLNVLRDTVRAEVIVTSVPGTGSITSRADMLDRQLQHKARGRGVNFLAHSMGGLDCRHLITHIKPEEYAPLSLTTISTPHRGSPFMDWCTENIGIGKLRQQELEMAKTHVTVPPPSSDDVSGAKPDTPFSLSLSSLPSSFTTLLLSIVDSPAYANLTSHYLNEVFNPNTPDDPTVKYFSVAGRMAGVSIWHPFWLPKMVLDGMEEKHRGKMKALWEQEMGSGTSAGTPLWAQEREWGNDGLVTVQSARWGEFLGIMEGCDHWEMRGARGIEFGVDLPAIPAIGLGVSTAGHRTINGDGWGLPDWGRFVGAWKKEEKIQRDAEAKAAEASGDHPKSTSRDEERKRESARDDAIIKSTTDRLSAVFDWLTDQVPSPSIIGGKSKVMAQVKAQVAVSVAETHGDDGIRSEMQKHMDQEGKSRMKNELASKKDLETFYVALSRKLYDEGL